jgi:hypothetical protein
LKKVDVKKREMFQILNDYYLNRKKKVRSNGRGENGRHFDG